MGRNGKLKKAKLRLAEAAGGSVATLGAPRALVSAGATLSGHISAQLTARRWPEAIVALRALRAAGEAPKLGALQRWVRLAALTAPDTAMEARVFDAMLRTVSPPAASGAAPVVTVAEHENTGTLLAAAPPVAAAASDGGGGGEPLPAGATYDAATGVLLHAPWAQGPARGGACGGGGAGSDTSARAATDAASLRPRVRPATFRVPAPNGGVMDIATCDAGAVVLDPESEGAAGRTRVDVAFVRGAFLITNVLSERECRALLAVSTAMGYSADPAYTFSSGDGSGAGAAGVIWLADSTLVSALEERCRPFLDATVSGGDLAGINSRWRLYRYSPGAVYRPHIDGAWPGSGVRDGAYVYDAYGDRWSRFTWLLYLNDDFEGGHTTFYFPGAVPGRLEARGVTPRAGCVLVFPHGDSNLAPLHEGSAVTAGAKYVLRTEVLYKVPPPAPGRALKRPRAAAAPAADDDPGSNESGDE